MFPDYPKLKIEIKKRFELLTYQKSRADPLLGFMRTIKIKEGNKMIYHTVDGKRMETSFTRFQSAFRISDEDIIEKGVEGLVEIADNIGSDMKSKVGKKVISDFNKITAKTGNVVDAKGKELSQDMLLEVINKMELSFDDAGNPHMPTMFVNPEVAEKIKDKIPEWEKDEEHKKKFDDLIKKKRDEWNDRESNRKLVD
jgi:hypothetical protein